MTKKLEDEFNLPPLDTNKESSVEETREVSVVEVENAITISEKINDALKEIRGMEVHDDEMDEIALEAMESYQQLMSLGMNMTDMAAGGVINNAAGMLKIALEAKDSKVTTKLKQLDLMIKKANLDQRAKKDSPASEEEEIEARVFDRNDLLAMLNKKDDE